MNDPPFYGMYRGLCANNVDPENLFRITAIVPQVFGTDGVSSWAWPMIPVGQTIILPNPGDGVWITFEGGDNEYPIWCGTWVNS